MGQTTPLTKPCLQQATHMPFPNWSDMRGIKKGTCELVGACSEGVIGVEMPDRIIAEAEGISCYAAT